MHMTDIQAQTLDLLIVTLYNHLKEQPDPKLLEALATVAIQAQVRYDKTQREWETQSRVWHLQWELRHLEAELQSINENKCSNHQLKKSKPTNPLTIISTTWTNFKRKLLK